MFRGAERRLRPGLVVVALLAQILGSAPVAQGQPPSAPATPAPKEDLPARVETLLVRDVVQVDGSGSRVVEARVLLRTAVGVAQFGQIGHPYIEGFGEVAFDKVEIVRADGAHVPLSNLVPEDINPFGMAASSVPADFRLRRITVPGLTAGDTLVYRIVATQRPLFPGRIFGEFKFGLGSLMAEQVYELDTPASIDLRVRKRPGLAAEWEETPASAGRRVRRLTVREPIPAPARGADPDVAAETLNEMDVMVTNFRTWDDVGRWWWAMARERFVPDDKVRAESQRLLAGITDPRGRIDALHAFVSTQVRYLNIGFGSGRFQPQAAGEVLANRYAECKGKHALFAALGAAAGLDIAPVAIHSLRKDLHDDVPSPGQFDHLVSLVRLGPDPSRWVWVDTTHDAAPAGYLVPALRDKRALLMDGSGGRVVRTPERPPFPARVQVEAKGALQAEGPIRARVRLTLRGDAEPYLRAAVRMTPREKWPELAKGMAREWTKGTFANVTAGDPSDLGTPFWIEYDVEHAMDGADLAKDWTFWIPLLEVDLPVPGAGRTIVTLADDEVVLRARFEMPEGMKARPPLSVALDRPFASYRSTYAVDGRTLTVERVFKVRQNKLGPEQKSEYESFRAAVRTDARQEFRVEAFRSGVVEALDTADALNSAGYDALDADDYERAETLFRQAVAKDPRHKWAWNNLGRVLRKRRRAAEALQAFDGRSRSARTTPTPTGTRGRRCCMS